MKNTIALLSIFTFLHSFSQEKAKDTLYNFKTINNEVIWQKIYPLKDSIHTEKIIQQIKTQEFTAKLKTTNNTFSGRSANTNKRLALKKIPYFAYWGFDNYLKIELKNNKFRVTATDFIFRGPKQNTYGVERKLDYPLNINTLKKGKFRTNKKTIKAMRLLDSVMNSKFILRDTRKDNW